MKLDRLMYLLAEQAKSAGRTELFCAPDVAEALSRAVPPAGKPGFALSGARLSVQSNPGGADCPAPAGQP